MPVTPLGPAAHHNGEALLESAPELALGGLALARRFSAGGTLWCIAPSATHHARHVAVEFVHPVVMGARSLPAVAIEDDAVDTARLLVRPGDVVLAIGAEHDPVIADLLRRGDAWGVLTMLLASGPCPESSSADHVVWVDSIHGGGVVLAYHLLWELTQVVFEHPGLLDQPAAGDQDACVTCSDEGRVAEVVAVVGDRTVTAMTGGHEEQVDTSVVDDVAPHDLLLVHAGVALTILERSAR